jgi:hypothetical protein
MHAMMDLLEQKWIMATIAEKRILVASIAAYAIIAFCSSFRGLEVFLVDLYGLRKHMLDPHVDLKSECIIIPLLGRFKGETGDRYHLTPLASTTSSGLRVKQWIEWLILVLEVHGRVRGQAFCDDVVMVETWQSQSCMSWP